MSAQLDIDFNPYRQVGRREYVLRVALENASKFQPEFYAWLKSNLELWERFEQEANKAFLRGRKHYSARTIIHYLRHETALREAPEAEWKINNNVSPDLARLWLLLNPERDGFFELRGRE